MSLLLSIILLGTGLSMFFVKDSIKKLGILYLTVICLSSVYIPFKIPYLTNATEYVSFCFLISQWKILRQNWTLISKTILYPVFIILFIGSILTWFNSPSYLDIWGLITIIKTDFLGRYLLILYPFLCIKDVNSIKKIVPIIYWSFTILFVFAVINYILHYNYFVDWALKSGGTVSSIMADMGGKYSNAMRFRVSGMFPNAFNYGYTCIGVLFLFIYFKHLKLISDIKFYTVVIYSLFGIVTCGCRTIILVTIIAFFVYLLLYYKLLKSIRILVFILLALFICSIIIPSIYDLFDKMLSIFSNNSDVEGSSIEMREEQWLATLFWLNDKFMFGQGYGFLRLTLEFGTDNFSAVELRGLENVTMVYLLERGIIGVIVFYSLYMFLIVYFIRKLKQYKLESSLGMTLLIASIVFANATGILLSYLITYLNVGIILCIINVNKKRIIVNGKSLCRYSDL